MSRSQTSVGTVQSAILTAQEYIAAINTFNLRRFSVQLIGVPSTPSAKNFVAANVDTGDDSAEISSHGLVTGLKGQLTSSGTLPAGLALATDYYIIDEDDDNVKFATTLANAVAGTQVDITDQGTGTHTFTATTSTSNTYKLQGSNDNSNWEDIGSALTINASTVTSAVEVNYAIYKYYRLLFTPDAGQTVISAFICSIL